MYVDYVGFVESEVGFVGCCVERDELVGVGDKEDVFGFVVVLEFEIMLCEIVVDWCVVVIVGMWVVSLEFFVGCGVEG